MKRTIFKVFTIGQFEKAENWLNEMSMKGMQLINVGFCKYVFEDGPKGQYEYRLELLKHYPSHPESMSYIRFLEEFGIEKIGTFLYWGYFRKKVTDEPFNLFSDIDSKIKHYRRIIGLSNIISILLFCYSVIMLSEAWNQFSTYKFWIDQGFSCTPYHIPLINTGVSSLILAIIPPLIVLPVHKTLNLLKIEQKISE